MATLVYRPSAAWKQKAYSKNTTMRGHGRIQNRSREPFLINTLLGEGANREDQTYLIRSLVYQERLFLRLSLFAFAQRPSSLLVLSCLATSVVHCLVCAASQEAVTPSSSLCFFSTYIYIQNPFVRLTPCILSLWPGLRQWEERRRRFWKSWATNGPSSRAGKQTTTTTLKVA